MGRGWRAAAATASVAAAALLLAACTASPAPTPSSATPTASPTPTLAAAACTWNAVRQQTDDGSLGQFAVALTNTSAGTCVLDGTPTAALTGGPRGTEGVPQATAAGFPAGPVVVPAGATAYAPFAISTTTDGGITGHCSDSKHTTLQLTPPGSATALSVDVALLHPCAPVPGFGWAAYPIQSGMPTAQSFG
jgi:hypothetical protein